MYPEETDTMKPVKCCLPSSRGFTEYVFQSDGSYSATGRIFPTETERLARIEGELRAFTGEPLFLEVTAVKDIDTWLCRSFSVTLTEERTKAIETASEAPDSNPEEISDAELLRILEQKEFKES